MNAQFLDRLINSARTTAEQSVEQQVNRKVEQGIDNAFNPESQQQEPQEQVEQQPQEQPQSGWTCPACGHKGNTGKFCTECGAQKAAVSAAEPVSFEPINFRLKPIQTRHQTPLRRIFEQKNVPKLAYMQFL